MFQNFSINRKGRPNLNLLHLLSFISNAVLERPVDNSQKFDSVAYIAKEILHFRCLAQKV